MPQIDPKVQKELDRINVATDKIAKGLNKKKQFFSDKFFSIHYFSLHFFK